MAEGGALMEIRYLAMRERRFLPDVWTLQKKTKAGDSSVSVTDGNMQLQAAGPRGLMIEEAVKMANLLGFPICQDEVPRDG